MHAYIITRGIKHEVDRFITELQGKYLPYNDGTDTKKVVQLAVRPIQLWEIVFPEDQLELIMNTLFEGTTRKQGNNPSYAKRNDKYLYAFRKVLNSKPFPPLNTKALSLPVYKDNIEVAGIGIKKDEFKGNVEQL